MKSNAHGPTLLRRALCAAAALALAAIAVWSVRELFFDSTVSQMGRVRAAAAAGALAVGAATFECIRRTQLRERYALLWLFPCLAVIFIAFFPGCLDAVRNAFGLSYGSVLAAVAFLALLFAMFVFSISLSRDESKIVQCAQRIAILEARIHDLESEKDGSGR